MGKGPLHATSATAVSCWALLSTTTIICGFSPAARHNNPLPRVSGFANPLVAPLHAWDNNGESRGGRKNSNGGGGNVYDPDDDNVRNDEESVSSPVARDDFAEESDIFKFVFEDEGSSSNDDPSLSYNAVVDAEDDDEADPETIDFSTSPLPRLRALDWIPTEEQLEKLTLQELRLACQQRRMYKFGSKDAILDRFRSWSVKEEVIQAKKAERRRLAKEMLSRSKQRSDTSNRGEDRATENDLYGQALTYKSSATRRAEATELYQASRRKEMRGDKQGAIDILYDLLKLTPEDGRVISRLARLHKPSEAVSLLQHHLRLPAHKTNGYLWHSLANIHYRRHKNTRLARRYYQQGINHGCVNSYHALGRLELLDGNTREAAQLFRRGIKEFPRNHRLYHALGTLQLEAGLFDQAHKTFKKGIEVLDEMHPDREDCGKCFMLLGLAFIEFEYNKDLELARYYIKQAIKIEPLFDKGWLALALLFESEVRKHEEDQDEEYILDNRPVQKIYQHAITSYEQSRGFISVTGTPNTIKSFKRSGDKWANVYKNYASFLESERHYEEAKLVLRKACQIFSYDWQVWENLALLTKNDSDFEACLKISKNSHAIPYLQYADHLIRTGRHSKAREVFYNGASNLTSTNGLRRLFHRWAEFEWYKGNVNRAEELYTLALRSIPPPTSLKNPSYSDQKHNRKRARIFYDMALFYSETDVVKAQHYCGLAVFYNSNHHKSWLLWADLTNDEVMSSELFAKAKVVEDGLDATLVKVRISAGTDPFEKRAKSLRKSKKVARQWWDLKKQRKTYISDQF
eukprot:CAMPEP_0196807042 /NCGR_PEP_ID=MMETSP1362-20130617/6990_1 /TAXON_ID=163516 /ORGANISM="Leptocylindrus danicus, Strain CCMP1856" /LENGTH=801 /DNA_ID=CAMNT_0042180795 /DNA_START=104 /DNA_END=2506 /DNA_ORIENTATION=+